MASPSLLLSFLLLLLLLLLVSSSSPQPLPSSQVDALLELRTLLENPPALTYWNPYSPFCYLPNTTTFSISCSSNHTHTNLTSLTILGNRTKSSPHASRRGLLLSSNFSTSSLLSALSALPALRSLTLVDLGMWGPLPSSISSLQFLQDLNLSSNYLYGSLPTELSDLKSLERLDLGNNLFKGELPDLSRLGGLEELDLGFNKLGPEFPVVGTGIVRLVLRNNSFKCNLDPGIRYLSRLEWLDVANNRLFGLVPAALFGTPSVRHLDLGGNSLSGALPGNLTCGDALEYVDLSRNNLVGGLPMCIRMRNSKVNVSVEYAWNCLSGVDSRYQHPSSYCSEKPLAVVLPKSKKEERIGAKNGLVLMLGIAGGIIGGALILALVLFVVNKKVRREVEDGEAGMLGRKKSPSRSVAAVVPPKVPADARHICTEVRGGIFSLKPYRIYMVQELMLMTNNFDNSNLMQEGLELKVYRGRLEDGSAVAIRCLKIKQKYSTPSMHKFLDVISKLRHRNLVSVLGHCIDSTEDHLSNATSIYLVFELVSNGTLRSHLTEWRKREMLKWPQRITAISGVARGIQFLHNGIAPGIFGNDLKIDNILLDKTLAGKIDNYNLPKIMLSKDKNNKVGGGTVFNPLDGKYVSSSHSVEHEGKEDIYQLGLILLEVITGKPPSTSRELETLKLKLQRIVSESSPYDLKELIDPAIEGTFAFDSLRTVVEITLNCLCKDRSQRPSIDDVLWNLQYSVQIQDALAGTEDLSGQF